MCFLTDILNGILNLLGFAPFTEYTNRDIKLYRRVNILVLGSSRVGKTCLIRRLAGLPSSQEYKPTVYDVYEKELHHKRGQFILEFVDTAGSHEFPAMQRLAISHADIFLVVYSLSDAGSFQKACLFAEEVYTVKAKHCSPFIWVQNKVDLVSKHTLYDFDKQQASKILLKKWVNQGHINASAKSGRNIFDILEAIVVETEHLCRKDMSSSSRTRKKSSIISTTFGFDSRYSVSSKL